MKTYYRLAFAGVIAVSLLSLASFAQDHAGPQPPTTKRDDVTETLHGVTITDPYRWLEDQQSAETRGWIKDENAYTRALLDARPGRDKLRQRFEQLAKIDQIELPVERHGQFIYRKRLANQEQYVIYSRNGVEGKEEVLLDPNPLSADHSTSFGVMELSNDGKLLAYDVRQGGKDESEIRFFDIGAHRDLPEALPAATYFAISFLPDRSAVYYSLMSADGPRVRFHKMGSPISEDTDVFGKGYEKSNIIFGNVSEDGRYLVVHVLYGSAADKVEIWTQDLQEKGSALRPLIKDINARFFAFSGGDHLFLQTNWKAPKGKVLSVDLKKPEQANWREIIPEKGDAIDQVGVAGGKIFVTYIHDVISVVKVFNPDGQAAGELKFPALGSASQISGYWGGQSALVEFSSFTIPPTIYRYEISSGKQSEWARINAPVRSEDFETKQVWYNSKDGTRVPIFLIHKRGIKLDGNLPTVLTGYGGFMVSYSPGFGSTAIAWAEHGGVYAVANLRGGGEFGEQWHRAGMLENKQNVFDDFIAAAQWLIANHYTNSDRLAITGGSNGGLLMGAAITQHPELFRAVICSHPLLDMIRYHKFMEAQFWVSEYGSSENAEQFKYIYAYSPYQHVVSGKKYPAVLFMTGDADTRVAPLHARKMAALMQTVATPDRPVMIRYETTTGHVYSSRSVTQIVNDQVDPMSFLLWQLGVEP